MDNFLLIVIIGFVVAFMFTGFRPRVQPPQIVYVPIETERPGSFGCLPVMAIGFLILVLANAFQ
jgi:hypothetical protein